MYLYLFSVCNPKREVLFRMKFNAKETRRLGLSRKSGKRDIWKRESHSRGIEQRLPCSRFWKITYPVGTAKKDLNARMVHDINRERFAKPVVLLGHSCGFFPSFLLCSFRERNKKIEKSTLKVWSSFKPVILQRISHSSVYKENWKTRRIYQRIYTQSLVLIRK